VFQTIIREARLDTDYSERTRRLELRKRVLDGTLYDDLPFEFHEERTPAGEYIPLRRRRPSVRYALPRVVVEDSVALLFSEGHFPVFDSSDQGVRTAARKLSRAVRLNAVMTDAARRGSIGSVAVLMRVCNRRIFLEVFDPTYLTPAWAAPAGDCLARVTERRKVRGSEMIALGYETIQPDAIYWFMRRWDSEWEFWFEPVQVGTDTVAQVDERLSKRHGLGFVPIAWIRNLPGGDQIDGGCTFEAAIDTSIEIDYQLSQAGRGLKYSSDPTLLIREPAGLDPVSVKGAANALVLSEKGDAKLLEIGGTASQAVIEYVRVLRELALESVHGNRVDSSRLAAPASGRAMELMNQGLLWLADNLRVSYGDEGIARIMRMMLRASQLYPVQVDDEILPELNANAELTLRWPEWYPLDSLDRQREAATMTSLVEAGQLSRETALHVLAPSYDIEDVPAELARIVAEKAA
jgi:hypothetical protein